MDGRQLRTAFGRFATGVTIITCHTPDHGPHGATVTAFTPISLDPPLIQVAMTRTSKASSHLDGAAFAVNILAADQSDLAMHFAGRGGADPVPWCDRGLAPALADTAATIICKPYRTDDGGDHVLFLGEVDEIELSDRAPLLFHDSAFHRIGERAEDFWFGCADDPHRGWFDGATVFTSLTGGVPIGAPVHR